jgi:GntR family transcriptional regulator / MocR family aminotransferase
VDVHIDLARRGDRTSQIYRQLLDAILDGRLRSGERLPATRDLAQQLAVSRTTVALAYDRLTADGFLVSRVGAGTFVCTERLRPTQQRTAPSDAGVRPRPLWQSLTPPSDAPRSGSKFDFRVGIPDASLFPLQTWRRLVSRELRPALTQSTYADPRGHEGLRQAIARHWGTARAVRASADDVLVTQGAQQAFDLIGRVLLEPGDRVAIEEPGYPAVRELFRSHGARVVGVPVDAEGLDVTQLPSDTRVVYVTPSHQFPTGTVLSLRRRTALLSWAERHDAVIIEDDYDSEFRFSDRPLRPLQSLDRSGRVIYVGSFSKTMLPMLRLGFLVAPASLHAALTSAKELVDSSGPSTLQGAMATFVDDGLLARHVRKAGRIYAARHDQVVQTLQTDYAAWLEPVPSSAGLHVCARVRPEADLDIPQLLDRARAVGVAVHSLARYCMRQPQQGLVLGYGAIETERIGLGLERLRTLIDS